MPMPSSTDEHYHILRGAGVDPRDSLLGNKAAHYSAKRNLNLKVLDFVKSGGPELTIGRTFSALWMRLL